MPLIVDTSRALRTHDDLVLLVQAILAADAEDETRAIEWKSGYDDLTSIGASFALARAVLGMANRPVSVAKADFEGFGYVVVGAEPYKLAGQAVPDSAELLNAMRRYTGYGKPAWDPRTVSVNGKNVLVILVDPPQPGDRMALLQKSHQPEKNPLVPEGTVFVRQPGATERASRADLDMLQDRLLEGIERNAEATRKAERHREIRDLIADMVHAANQWAASMEIIVIMSAGANWSMKDLQEWTNSDSGRELTANAELIKQNARKLRLTIAETSLLEPLQTAQNEFLNSAAFDGVWSGRSNTGEARSNAYRHINAIKTTFHQVELAAARLLSNPLTGNKPIA